MPAATEETAAPATQPAAKRDLAAQAALASAVAVVGIALLGLVGGLTGTRIVDSPMLALVPMAPSTALLFLLLALLPQAAAKPLRISPRAGIWLAALAGGVALLNLAGRVFNLPTGVLDWSFRHLNAITGAPHVSMSPATATLFVMASAAAVPLAARAGGLRMPGQGAAGLLAAAVALCGAVFLLGYAYGTPLLYHSGVVPMARSTALAFLLLGIGLVCEAGPELAPLRPFTGPSAKAALLRAFVPLVVGLSLAHSLLLELGGPNLGEGNALVVAGIAVASAATVGLAVLLVARRVGGALEQAELRRDAAERVVRSALLEKTVMLKELHHRVKNNIQIVSSLLTLQSEYVVDPRDRELFEASRKRLKTMAMVHEHLYASPDLSFVDMRGYVERLVEQLVGGATPPVRTVLQLEDVRLPIGQCVPCGLLLNELVMNAMKHAFPNAPDPELRVVLRADAHEMELTVEDNGPGLPPGFELTGHSTLGMLLVGSLAQQLRGQLTAHNAARGARFSLRFPYGEE